MLKLLKRYPVVDVATAPASSRSPSRDDLRIRNLLDDPGLREAMGLAVELPAPRFDRRRLLDDAAA